MTWENYDEDYGKYPKDSTVAPGLYQMRLDKIYPDEAGKKGEEQKPVCRWEFTVLAGPLADTPVEKVSWLHTEDCRRIFKQELCRAGLDHETTSEAAARLGELIGKTFEVKVVQNGKYTNVNINSQIDIGDVDTTSTSNDEPDEYQDDDIPF